jgi:hypothetical protein
MIAGELCILPEGHAGPHTTSRRAPAEPPGLRDPLPWYGPGSALPSTSYTTWSGAAYVSKVSVHRLRDGRQIPEPESPYVLEAISSHVVDARTDEGPPIPEPHLIVVWRPVKLR